MDLIIFCGKMLEEQMKKIKKNIDLDFLFWYMHSQIYAKHFFSDKDLIKNRFKNKLNREVNLKNPQRYNDKLQWLKLKWRSQLAITCADKYKVRDFVRKKIGKKVLNKIYRVYESVDDIRIEDLPNQFVLKPNHGTKSIIFCDDKKKINWKYQFLKMKIWLKTNFYWPGREYVYKEINPKIICERYLQEEDGTPPKDYKIFCFHGEPKLIEIDIDRFSSHKRNFYDLNWNLLDLQIEYPNDSSLNITKPERLEEIIKYSRVLSKNFPHVRVDLYNIKGEIFFGELTFFHESGFGKFNSPKYEYKIGKWIHLDEIPKENIKSSEFNF